MEQDFLFDSIIFNTLSLYDYTSCLLKFIIEKNKQKKKLLWGQLVRTFRQDPILKNTNLATCIDTIEKEWLSKLGEYRAELIHYRDDSSNYELNIDIISNSYILKVHAPYNLRKHLKSLNSSPEVSINTSILWVMEVSLSNIQEIVQETIKYIDENRQIPIGQEILQIKHK